MKLTARLKDRILHLIGIEPMTNRDLALDELAEMPGCRFFVNTGLASNDAVHEDMKGLTCDEWLDKPATMQRIFKEGTHGEIQHHRRGRSTRFVL